MVLNKELKRVMIQLDSWNTPNERYLVESEEDLNKFLYHEDFDHCWKIESLLIKPWLEFLNKGRVLLISDNTVSGYPSYFTYNKEKFHEIKRS